jgi:ABC-type oligopeptide transport system ATPase subunit
MQPDTPICDEPVASLDVSIQAQALNFFLRVLHGKASTWVDVTCAR